jgi:CRISPR-associated protein Csy1
MPPPEVTRLRAVIDGFLAERLQAKLDKIKDATDDARQAARDDHQAETWIADAAYRVNQIQQVSHGLKFTHPDAKGSQLYSHGNPAAGDCLIGTHTLKGNALPDVVGNAAALDVYKFLRLELDGKSLLVRALESDPALMAALTDDEERARNWMAAFAQLASPKGEPSSHALAKQVYWPLDDGQYHLLAPLFPTSLVHRVWTTLREDRFSESAKAAREAKRNRQPHDDEIHDYPHFAIQKFGGTKPQNISQLNSERHGEAYLLAAVPPNWRSDPVRLPLRVETVFGPWFGRRRRVLELTKVLKSFLLKVQDVNNIAIRSKRAELVDLICEEVLQFAAELHEQPPDWTHNADCRLNLDERYWLDPWRALDDEAFAATRAVTDWREAICKRFGNWLNARLDTDRTPMGESEHQEWRKVLDSRLRLMREELDPND